MPWSETDMSKERVRFVLEWERRWNAGEGVVNVSELCREFDFEHLFRDFGPSKPGPSRRSAPRVVTGQTA